MPIAWWTLGLQAVNVLVLVWLLARFLYRPVLAAIEKRRTEVEAVLHDAAEARERAKEAEADLARRHDEAASAGDRIIAEAKSRAEAEVATQLRRTGQAAVEMRSAAEAAIARERKSMQQDLAGHASALAIAIAHRLLAQIPRESVADAFVARLRRGIAALPNDARLRLTAGPLEIIGASPLDQSAEKCLRAMLRDVLGSTPAMCYHIRPALLGGFELRSSDILIRASWEADLARIAQALKEEQGHDVAA